MIETFRDGLPADIHDLAERVMHAICDHQWTVSLAESCTGGLLAAVLTDVEGCSHGFDRGFVTYTDEAKQAQLNVPTRLIAAYSAVSAPVASAMVEGALARSNSHLALSVTGFAGPGGEGEEPGLVYFGVQRRGQPAEVEERHFGDGSRAAVRIACLRVGLGLLYRFAT